MHCTNDSESSINGFIWIFDAVLKEVYSFLVWLVRIIKRTNKEIDGLLVLKINPDAFSRKFLKFKCYQLTYKNYNNFKSGPEG